MWTSTITIIVNSVCNLDFTNNFTLINHHFLSFQFPNIFMFSETRYLPNLVWCKNRLHPVILVYNNQHTSIVIDFWCFLFRQKNWEGFSETTFIQVIVHIHLFSNILWKKLNIILLDNENIYFVTILWLYLCSMFSRENRVEDTGIWSVVAIAE